MIVPAILAVAVVVAGPITGGSRDQPFGAMPPAEQSASGYVEREYFFGGTASAFAPDGPWTQDGVWQAKPAGTADYKVRMLVRRPADAAKCNGVVIVEWLNVTALVEGAADYSQMQEELVRDGYVWVGVGAQAVGVNSQGGLKAWDPARYGSLVHPGDAYSYDIFTQAGAALRQTTGVQPLAGLTVKKIIADGRSQSAFRLVTYINAVHLRARTYDGFFIHSRGAQAAGWKADALSRDTDNPVPAGAKLRTDIDVPVLDLQTEGDMVALRSHLTRQDPNPHYRRWELAGGAHAEVARWIVEVPPPLSMGQGCRDAVNAAPHHAVVKAALRAITKWVRDGVVPPQSPAIELTDPAAADPIARDSRGNAKGGIRLPELEAPTAVLDGGANDGAPGPGGSRNFCFLFGRTRPFDDATLKTLYPNHAAFVQAFTKATDALEHDGYLLKPEADAARAAAADSRVGR
jgi:hypothetical protein